jgi:hypothetical protein
MQAEMTLTEEEVKEIIKQHFIRLGKFKNIGEVKINVGTRTMGTYLCGRDNTYEVGHFNSIKVKVEI